MQRGRVTFVLIKTVLRVSRMHLEQQRITRGLGENRRGRNLEYFVITFNDRLSTNRCDWSAVTVD